VTAIRFPDFVDDRADVLAAHNVNGMQLALVALPPGPAPDHADIDLRFYNDRHLPGLLAEIAADPARVSQIFRVRGGTRILAGPATGQVKVTAVTSIDAVRLSLRVEPVGDYSTYTLELVWDASRIDPFFSTIAFKFRPGCFTNDCAPALPGRPLAPGPVIDYLAKDYDSFRHVLMTAMAQRVPGWQSTSEADHDQVLIDLFAAAADELSDYQDRVMNEAYFATARGRVSLARHARLVDYHIHEGNQASTWLAVEVLAGQTPFTLVNQEIVAWTGAGEPTPDSIFFSSRERRLPAAQKQRFDPLVNRLLLHTWRNAQPALRAGSTSADVVPDVPGAGQPEADALRDLIRSGQLRQILIAERLNPLTGRVPGRDARKRQLLQVAQRHRRGRDDRRSGHQHISRPAPMARRGSTPIRLQLHDLLRRHSRRERLGVQRQSRPRTRGPADDRRLPRAWSRGPRRFAHGKASLPGAARSLRRWPRLDPLCASRRSAGVSADAGEWRSAGALDAVRRGDAAECGHRSVGRS
jgi:hypothetical protein